MNTKELLEKYDKKTQENNKERPLWNLLKANEKHIEGLIEEDSTGHWFHKAFRQTDVTDTGYMDMAIWELLHYAPLFWELIAENAEEVTCNMCGEIMQYNDEDGIYDCTNSECTRCREE